MKEFAHLGQFVAHLAAMAAAEEIALHKGLQVCAKAIERTAKSEFGVYQPEVGQFEPWAPLAETTMADRVRRGFTADDPLLRSGHLRDSISSEVHALSAVVGSNDEVMVYQELGTDKMPPRAVLGPAAIRNKELIINTLGHAVAEGILYGSGATWTKLEST